MRYSAWSQYSSLTVHRALKAFSLNARQPDGALVFYSNISSASAVAKDAIYVTTLLLGDGFLTYRLFIVWNRAWWITVVPILLVLGTAGKCSCGPCMSS